MTHRLRALVAGLVLAAPTVTSVVVAPVPACAGGTGPRAALVIDTGASADAYCVVLGAPTVDGLELIRLASRQHGLAYTLGFGGQAVCSLAGVGPTGNDCFADYPEFWGYWRGDGSGGWSWSSSGAGSVRVGNGDIEGWSWGTGDSGGTHEPPPTLAFHDVCAVGADGSGGSGGGGAGGTGRGDQDDGGGPRANGGPETASEPSRGREGGDGGRSPLPSETRTQGATAGPDLSTPSEVQVRAAGTSSDDPMAGPPIAPLGAAVLLTLLVAGGWKRIRGLGRSG